MEKESCNKKCCFTKCIAIIALSISVFCLGFLSGKCIANCENGKNNCKDKKEWKNHCKTKKTCPTNGKSCSYEKDVSIDVVIDGEEVSITE